MKHCLLLKLVPGTDLLEVQEKLWKTYRKLDDELDWLNHPVIYRRSDGVDSSYDLMAVIDLDGEERLADYLSHPLTQKLEGKLEKLVESRAAFNHY